MENINYICCQLLHCGYLDLKFLDGLMKTYNLDLYVDDIKDNYGRIDDINIIIYEAYNQIKNMFFHENEEAIKSLGYSIKHIEENEEYTIIANYFASDMRFNIPEIDVIFQNWR